jgi:SAM-dependent methyltransferase
MSDYDGFADKYDQTFQLTPFRTHIEAYSLLKLAGDVRGQAWLDLACGTGPYARALRRRGAEPVVGVDLSADMLRVARTAEDQEPLGIEYLQQDVGSLPRLRDFDFDGAFGSYLLHYATSAGHLRGMCHGIAANLRPGGRFITYQLNPDISRKPGYYLPYGAEIDLDPHRVLADGDGITFRIRVGDFRSPEVTVHYWSRAALDGALGEAGLEEIRWIRPSLSPEAAAGPNPEQWTDYLNEPLCVIISAVKA